MITFSGASLVLRLVLLVPNPKTLRLCLHEVWIFGKEPRHRHLIALLGVPLLKDNVGLPLHRVGHNVRWWTYELRIRLGFDLRKDELQMWPAELPSGMT